MVRHRAPRDSKAGLCSCSQEAEKPADCCGAAAGPGAEAEAGPEEAEAGPDSVLGSGPGEAAGLPGLWGVLGRWSHSCQTL